MTGGGGGHNLQISLDVANKAKKIVYDEIPSKTTQKKESF